MLNATLVGGSDKFVFFQTGEGFPFLPLEWSSNRYGEEELANLTERQQEEMVDEIINKTAEIVFSKEVWFMIDEKYGRYGVLMYYDNKFNQANGKDL